VFSEINWANKRMTALRLSYGVAESDRAPDTYAEFPAPVEDLDPARTAARRRAAVTRSGNNGLPGSTGRLMPAMASHLLLQRRAGPRRLVMPLRRSLSRLVAKPRISVVIWPARCPR